MSSLHTSSWKFQKRAIKLALMGDFSISSLKFNHLINRVQVASGKLLRVWAGHYKAVSCLVFSDDDSLLISGADDGIVNVWPLLR